MKNSKPTLLCLTLVVASFGWIGCHTSSNRAAVQLDGWDLLTTWVVDRADCLCGLDDPRMLSHPARVQYPILYRATPEIRQMEEKHIDPASPEGVVLRHAAQDRIQRACETVRVAKQYCSIWKAIRHLDGRAIDDVTEEVKQQL